MVSIQMRSKSAASQTLELPFGRTCAGPGHCRFLCSNDEGLGRKRSGLKARLLHSGAVWVQAFFWFADLDFERGAECLDGFRLERSLCYGFT